MGPWKLVPINIRYIYNSILVIYRLAGSIKCLHINSLNYFFAHITSKSSKGKRPMENNAQPSQAIIQAAKDAVNPMLTPLEFSQQLMVHDC